MIHTLISGFTRRLPALSLAALLAGCTATADTAKLAAEQRAPLLRSDQFQAAADNGKVLLVVGNNGVVVASRDRGASWQRSVVDAGSSLIGIAACADGSFAALDFFHRVWLADAAGGNWQAKELKEPTNPLAIACDAKNRLWVVGSGSTIVASADHGASWRKSVVGGDAMLASVQFIDERRGYVTGEFGAVLQTDDGGDNWRALTPIGADFYPYAAVFADSEKAWVSGLAGVVMHTADGGRTWVKQANPAGAPVYGLARAGGETLGVGVNGLIFRDAGGKWELAAVKPTGYLRAALPLADGRVLLAGGGGAVEVTAMATFATDGNETPSHRRQPVSSAANALDSGVRRNDDGVVSR